MVIVKNLTFRRGERILFHAANFTLNPGDKVGVVGLNGCGKSTLFSLLLGKNTPDQGEIKIPPKLTLAHLEQEVPQTDEPVLQYAMRGDREVFMVMQQLQQAEQQHEATQIAALHNRLYELHGYDLTARAAKILLGLGFSSEQQKWGVNQFSGGWKMRMNLAQVLLSNAEMLLLDEPTNYLDLNAIVWLEGWLHDYSGTVLVISHDRDFLDQVTTGILHITAGTIHSYRGNYTSFERQRAEHLAQERSLYAKQQQRIQHLTNYIERFRAKASKARQAQSRLKALEKMELVQLSQIDTVLDFKFLPSEVAGDPLISLKQVTVGYAETPILRRVNFQLHAHSLVGILGENGSGKSTLMKTLVGELTPQSGEIWRHPKIKIGYFAQHQLERLDLNSSPLLELKRIDRLATEQQLRNFLGQFNFSGDMVTAQIQHFSGGEKARLSLALIIWQRPNLLLLDEPTNHLDLTLRETLAYALQSYDGAMLLVAHDRYLLNAVVNDFYLIHNQEVKPFDGSLTDYHNWLLHEQKQRMQRLVTPSLSVTTNVVSAPVKKKPNQFKLTSIEERLAQLYQEKEQLAVFLSQAENYLPGGKQVLEQKLSQSQQVEQEIKKLETEWEQLLS